MGDFVTLSPGVYVNGECKIGDGAFFGTGAIVTPRHEIGAGAKVGAGAVVLDDVPEAPPSSACRRPLRRIDAMPANWLPKWEAGDSVAKLSQAT